MFLPKLVMNTISTESKTWSVLWEVVWMLLSFSYPLTQIIETQSGRTRVSFYGLSRCCPWKTSHTGGTLCWLEQLSSLLWLKEWHHRYIPPGTPRWKLSLKLLGSGLLQYIIPLDENMTGDMITIGLYCQILQLQWESPVLPTWPRAHYTCLFCVPAPCLDS